MKLGSPQDDQKSPTAAASGEPKSNAEKYGDMKKKITLRDFFDPSKPWVLCDNGSFLGFFDFIPENFRFGPWHTGTKLVVALLFCLAVHGIMWMQAHSPSEGWMARFEIDDKHYEAYTMEWSYNVAIFCWMIFVCHNVIYGSPLSTGAWISFTLWSWTVVTVRHGLCALAPFSHSVRWVAEVLRFPALLSASMTTIIWNFVLFPAILIWFIKDETERKKFIGFFTNFRLIQLHVFNLLFAAANGALVGPFRELHLGDLAAGFSMVFVYMMFYLFILDRLGMHLYPIFSPRTPLAIPSFFMVILCCAGGYRYWQSVLEP